MSYQQPPIDLCKTKEEQEEIERGREKREAVFKELFAKMPTTKGMFS